MPRSTQQMRERRERIIAAARSIVSEKGYAGLSMRVLAEASGVTIPTIYNLIGAKDDVAFAVVSELMQGFTSRLEAQDNLVDLIESALDDFVSLPAYCRELLPILASRMSIGEGTLPHPMRLQIEGALRKAKSTGDLKEGADPVVLSERLQTHIEATSIQWSKGELDDTSFRAAALFEVALVGAAVFQGSAVDHFREVLDRTQPDARLRDVSGEQISRAEV